jgi:hypothetical protein
VSVNVSGNMSSETVSAFMQYLERMPAEFVVLAWQLALKRDESLFATPAFVDFAKRYKAVFTD